MKSNWITVLVIIFITNAATWYFTYEINYIKTNQTELDLKHTMIAADNMYVETMDYNDSVCRQRITEQREDRASLFYELMVCKFNGDTVKAAQFINQKTIDDYVKLINKNFPGIPNLRVYIEKGIVRIEFDSSKYTMEAVYGRLRQENENILVPLNK